PRKLARIDNMLNSLGKALIGTSLNALALAAVAWVAFDAWQRCVFQGALPEPASVAVEPIAAEARAVDINAVVRSHLFGRVDQAGREPVQRAAPPPRLVPTLAGVIAVGDDRRGPALIGTGRGRQQVVRVGEAIGDTDAVLAEVAPDHVLIGRGGELEKLAIKRPELGQQGGGRASADVANLPVAFDESTLAPAPAPVPAAIQDAGQAAGQEAAQAPLPGSVADGAGPPAEADAPTRLTLPF